ncbi:NERD domain-containing protein [Bacteroides thetaiotaomicron]|nr:NERD domain-containing protein [Bacteroides thetaiotaomicron]
MTLLYFLKNVLDDSFEVYFNPFLNGDRPDVLIMRKDYGVMIIEVKDWNLHNFKLDNRKNGYTFLMELLLNHLLTKY